MFAFAVPKTSTHPRGVKAATQEQQHHLGEDMDRRESMLAMEIKLKEKEIALVEAKARLQSQNNQQDFQTKMMEMLQNVIANKK